MSVACDFSPILMHDYRRQCKFCAVRASFLTINPGASSHGADRFSEGQAVE
jgi:hypothetical protein